MPALSVVIAATWSAEATLRTVASVLDSAAGQAAIEVIVVSSPDRMESCPFPDGVNWIEAEPRSSMPRLRQIGADAAIGPVCAFLEDACVVRPGWVEALIKAFTDDCLVAATGPVARAAPATPVDWAVYLAEYGPFATGGDRPIARLAGINFALRREALTTPSPIREAEVAERLLATGGRMMSVAGAEVTHTRQYRFGPAVVDRHRFGLEYGRERWGDGPGPRIGRLAAPAILLIQLARIGRILMRQPRLIGTFVRCSPRLLVMLGAWSIGEAKGWARYRGGLRQCETEGRPSASKPVPAGL